MQAGKLRQRVEHQRQTVTGQNSYGQKTYTWDAVGTYWAEVRAMQGKELDIAQQKWAEARFKVTVRYQPSVEFKRADRLVWGTRNLDIIDAEDPDGRQDMVVIVAKEYVS